jgi:hypothetical protein
MNIATIPTGIIKLGTEVIYRGAWGSDAPKRVKVVGLTLTDHPRDKYGKSVKEVTIDDVKANKVCFDLSDNHWCYSDQIRGVDLTA